MVPYQEPIVFLFIFSTLFMCVVVCRKMSTVMVPYQEPIVFVFIFSFHLIHVRCCIPQDGKNIEIKYLVNLKKKLLIYTLNNAIAQVSHWELSRQMRCLGNIRLLYLYVQYTYIV